MQNKREQLKEWAIDLLINVSIIGGTFAVIFGMIWWMISSI